MTTQIPEKFLPTIISESEDGTHTGNDWIGMFFATIAALVVAVMVIVLVDKVTGLELHNWIADAFISLVEMV